MIDYALEFDNKVLNHELTACQDIYQCCKIDKKNRQLTKEKSYPYYYDKKLVDQHIKLAKVISPKPLALFQLWYLSILNGFRFKRDPRIIRYNQSILSMARKNAKSYLSAVDLLTELIISELRGEIGKTYYIIANKKAQALLTLRTCRAMMKRLQQSSELARNFKLNKDTIYSTVTGSYIKALPSNPNSLDGLRVDGCCLDEYHSLNSPKLLEVLQSAMGQSPGGKILITSTTGFSYSCPFHSDFKLAEKELKNENTKSRSFNAIFTQDSKDEIYKDPKSWVKSNPLLMVSSVKPSMMIYLKDQLNKAIVSNRENNVRVKLFNTWGTLSDNNFIDLDKWKANEVRPIDLTNRKNVVLGLDLSRIHDLTAISMTVPLKDGKYYTTTHAFVADNNNSIQKKSKSDGIDYLELEATGHVTICRKSYGLVDYQVVAQYIQDLIKKYRWKNCTVAYDPWQAGDIIQILGDDPNINLIKVSQSVKNLTGVISWLYRLIISHKLLHDKSPLYDYTFANLVASYNAHGNIYLGKKRANSTHRIDNVFSLLDSLFVQKSIAKQNKSNNLSKQLKNNNFIF